MSDTPQPELTDLLDLEQLDSNLFRSRASQRNLGGALFGGQILGQGLKAAALTVEGRKPHSLHGYFLLPGSVEVPVIYDVEMTRDGGSFSTRRIVARQRARTIFSMEVSFHREEQGYEHDTELDVQVPEPDAMLNTRQLADRYAEQLPDIARERMQRQLAMELRPINFEDFYLRRAQSARGLYWLRAASPVPADAVSQQAGLAYLSDFILGSIVTLKHTNSAFEGRAMMASLDHAMWFHRDVDLTDWILVDAQSPFASGGRGLVRAQIFNRQRKLIASVAQEALVRPSKPAAT
jgi:acyl-CoA thioesterase-2